jgi:hypothetical protein
MATINDAYQSIANLNLWFKTRTGDDLVLTDIPNIIPLRWPYFRDNWEFIKPKVLSKVAKYQNPDFLSEQINDFTSFIESQRISSKKINPFSDGIILNKFYAVFDNISIQDVNLSNEETRLIQLKTQQVAQYSKNDFLTIKAGLTDYRDRYADTVNLSDVDYNRTHNKSSIPAQLTAGIVDMNMLLTMQNSIKTVDFILANLFAVDAFVDPFALARANANNSDVNIGKYASGTLVKMHLGEDLEALASRYFNDPNKWLDIAIANGLKPPYIDEIGQALSLLSNGSGNQINVGPTDSGGTLNIDKFFINQVVFLQSNTQLFPEQRNVLSIRQIPVSNEIVIELDGEANLDRYKVSENANIRVYAPNTINSSFFILIPSSDPLPDSRREEVPWFLAKSAEDERRAKIDLAIDENGELNFGTNGDLKLSYGLANAIQAIKLKLLTELGTLRYHPDFGFVNIIGNKNSDLESLKSMIVDSLNAQIGADPRFDRVESLSVDYVSSNATTSGAGAIAISMTVRLAGGSKVIPISFTVRH